MHIFSWLSNGTSLLYFLPSMILLIVVSLVCVRIYVVICLKTLSPKLFKIFLIPVVLLGFIFWALPLNMGFYEFFRAFFDVLFSFNSQIVISLR